MHLKSGNKKGFNVSDGMAIGLGLTSFCASIRVVIVSDIMAVGLGISYFYAITNYY